jgi:hypothetical protein
MLDGEHVGGLRSGSRWSADVVPGEHQLWLKLDHTGGAVAQFTLEPGQQAQFVCLPTGRSGGRRKLIAIIFKRQPSIELRAA